MDIRLPKPIGIHLVPVRPATRAEQPQLMRGVVFAFAIQGAAALAIAGSWLLLKH